MLYDRDYRILSEKEKNLWDQAELLFEKAKDSDGSYNLHDAAQYHLNLPVAAYHYQQLFPNNFLNPSFLRDTDTVKVGIDKFKSVLNDATSEREILNHIRTERSYYIIGAILNLYPFGHHRAFLFKEFELPPNHVVDYLLIGKNSDGYHFVFVEMESPVGQITLSDGALGTAFRKGLNQISDWESWLESNFSHLKLMFEKFLGATSILPNEFFEFDKSRIHFVVVAGKRKDFKEKTYSIRRKYLKSMGVNILHYDNLVDLAYKLAANRLY
ncbi:MAG: DUF4263 domain-containing protein [Chitinophagales bacterium]